MRNTLQVNSISVEVHWHMLQMAVSETQPSPFNTEDVYRASTKGKCRMISNENPFSNQEFKEHQVLFTK